MHTAPQAVETRHRRPALKALTPVRFFAAMYVVVAHVYGGQVSGAGGAFLKAGYTGVTLFFVLSGFILAYNYPVVEQRRQFWTARLARIYPVYALSLALCFVRPGTWRQPHLGLSAALSFGLLQAYWPPLAFALNTAAWTLSVEAFFYAVYPLVLPWVRGMTWKKFWLWQAGYAAFVCVPLILQAAQRGGAAGTLAAAIEGPFPLFRLNTFLVGVFAGLRFERRGRTDGGSRGMLTVGLVASAALLGTALPVTLLPLRTYLLTYSYLLVLIGVAPVKWRVLTHRWMQVAGEISYGVYVLQFPLLLASDGVFRAVLHREEPVWAKLAELIVAAYVTFRWIETPARSAVRRPLGGAPRASG